MGKYRAFKNKNLLMRLSESQNHRCCYCGHEVITFQELLLHQLLPPSYIKFTDYDIMTAEHIIDRSKGGKDNIENLAMACQYCNNARQDMDAVKYFEFIFRNISKIRDLKKTRIEDLLKGSEYTQNRNRNKNGDFRSKKAIRIKKTKLTSNQKFDNIENYMKSGEQNLSMSFCIPIGEILSAKEYDMSKLTSEISSVITVF